MRILKWIILIIVLVVIPLAFVLQHYTDSHEKPMKDNMVKILHAADTFRSSHGGTYGSTKGLIYALSAQGMPMDLTSDIASDDSQLSVAVNIGGNQIILVSYWSNRCIGVLESKANQYGTYFTYYSDWSAPTSEGCNAASTPADQLNNTDSYTSKTRPSWSINGWSLVGIPPGGSQSN